MTQPTDPIVDTEVRIPLPVEDRVSRIVDEAFVNHIGVIPDYTDDSVIEIVRGPEPYLHPNTGQVVGYQVWVGKWGPDGELPIDGHRVFVNPPDDRYIDANGLIITDTSMTAVAIVEDAIVRTVAETPGV